MQRIDKYILRSFLGIFLKTLGISIFFLLMQMVWKYVDDLAGRGIEWFHIIKLMFFWSASVLPMAVPIAVLFAGIMVFGDLSESKEFAAAKSSGASFYRLIRPILLALALISSGMFIVSNNLIPVANFKGENLLINIAKQRPTFNLQPGIFYGGIDGYSIKIGEKSDNEIYDIIIYNHKERGKGNHSLVTAPTGLIKYNEGNEWMEFILFDGHSYQEYELESKRSDTREPFLESTFKKMLIRLDMGSYAMGDLYKVSRSDEYNMLNVSQLNIAINDLYKKYRKRQNEVSNTMRNKFFGWKSNDSSLTSSPYEVFNVQDRVGQKYLFRATNNSIHLAQSNRDFMNQVENEFEWRRQIIARHFIEFHKKFAVSVACILLFFIGAPLGAIIQKGGFGLPFVISVLLFLFHYILSIIFEKMGREWLISPFWAIWLPNIVLLPISIWMTIWAANDASMNSFNRLRLKFFNLKRHLSE
jgi:lipopolysaccharide export system permease protein|tara:strand:+ start:5841 stop:7256 length:1416 start_codon:yes stop_codon:yes gene_type:complete